VIITLLFLAALLGGAFWWLARQGLTERPWLRTGPGEVALAAPLPPAKVGLGVFMAVVATLLVLLVSAYSIRMEMADWSPPPQPALLWVNTVVLGLASLALHRAVLAARRADRRAARAGLLAGFAATLAFLLGQALAWRELAAAGYLPAGNPADAFFYLITALHGLHLLGGLAAIGRTALRLRHDLAPERLRLSVELCATYAHFLLVAWLGLFGVMAFSPSFGWLVAICTAPFR
jgi:cytochrome c oxidase subunit 3